jgi:diketogulonate reductase-like aldo/keto reductase
MASTGLKITDTYSLPNSVVKMPRLGFGVFESHGQQCVDSVLAALKAGYRHIDTAQYYENEKEVGEAVRQSGLQRSEVFITTKIEFNKGSVEESYRSLLESVRAIDGDNGVGNEPDPLSHDPSSPLYLRELIHSTGSGFIPSS